VIPCYGAFLARAFSKNMQPPTSVGANRIKASDLARTDVRGNEINEIAPATPPHDSQLGAKHPVILNVFCSFLNKS
jgi:hypothetical protein